MTINEKSRQEGAQAAFDAVKTVEAVSCLTYPRQHPKMGNCYLSSVIIQTHSSPLSLLHAQGIYQGLFNAPDPFAIGGDQEIFAHPLITARSLGLLTDVTDKSFLTKFIWSVCCNYTGLFIFV